MLIYGVNSIVNTDNAALKVSYTSEGYGAIYAWVGSPKPIMLAEYNCEEVASMALEAIWTDLVAGKPYHEIDLDYTRGD